jgi:hypothetical protein
MTTVYYLHKTKNKKIEIKSLTAPEAIFNNASQRMKIEKKKKEHTQQHYLVAVSATRKRSS